MRAGVKSILDVDGEARLLWMRILRGMSASYAVRPGRYECVLLMVEKGMMPVGGRQVRWTSRPHAECAHLRPASVARRPGEADAISDLGVCFIDFAIDILIAQEAYKTHKVA